MKFKSSTYKFLLLFFLFANLLTFAQEIIKQDTVKKPKAIVERQKIDGIIATVGDFLILDSDIDKSYLELDVEFRNTPRCEMLGKMLEDKFYAHHAIQDSLKVTDGDIRGIVEDKISQMMQDDRLNTMEKVVKFYRKNSEEEFRTFLFDIIKMGKLSSEMRNKIIDEVKITPEEVRNYFKKIPTSELPIFGDEMEVAQIVKAPKVSEAEKQKVIDKLKGFKQDILAGSSFYSKAVLYSQDPGSKSIGGFMKVNRKTPLVKSFKDVAFSLNEGEISDPFETEFGYHIILVEKIRGNDLDLRHILLFPKLTEDSVKEAREEIIQIRNKILNKEITFADAARSSSDEKETRANGGALLNPRTQDTHFELTKMDPSLYSMVSNLKEGEICQPFMDKDQSNKDVFKIITVTNRISSHLADYAKDYLKIKELALKDKQIKAIAKWFNEKIKETYIKVNAEYRDCVFVNNWLKK
jgi:peptidyl-prolyl cis-trans isomerase SurA